MIRSANNASSRGFHICDTDRELRRVLDAIVPGRADQDRRTTLPRYFTLEIVLGLTP